MMRGKNSSEIASLLQEHHSKLQITTHYMLVVVVLSSCLIGNLMACGFTALACCQHHKTLDRRRRRSGRTATQVPTDPDPADFTGQEVAPDAPDAMEDYLGSNMLDSTLVDVNTFTEELDKYFKLIPQPSAHGIRYGLGGYGRQSAQASQFTCSTVRVIYFLLTLWYCVLNVGFVSWVYVTRHDPARIVNSGSFDFIARMLAVLEAGGIFVALVYMLVSAAALTRKKACPAPCQCLLRPPPLHVSFSRAGRNRIKTSECRHHVIMIGLTKKRVATVRCAWAARG